MDVFLAAKVRLRQVQRLQLLQLCHRLLLPTLTQLLRQARLASQSYQQHLLRPAAPQQVQ